MTMMLHSSPQQPEMDEKLYQIESIIFRSHQSHIFSLNPHENVPAALDMTSECMPSIKRAWERLCEILYRCAEPTT